MRRVLTALRRQIAALRPRRLVLAPVPVRRPAAQRGLTLVEMLVTVAITLIMMAAVVNVFASIGQSVQHRRASIEVSNQLRIARALLAEDFARATAKTLPPRDPSSGEGYLELIEGIHTDWFPTRLTDGVPTTPGSIDQTGNSELSPVELGTSIVPRGRRASQDNVDDNLFGLGDFDDVLALTVRSEGEPFVGRFGTTTIKSNEAEIIWYAVENPAVGTDHPLYLGEPGMRTVYRRVLLIAPWVENIATDSAGDVVDGPGGDPVTHLTYEIMKLNEQLASEGLRPLPLVDDGAFNTLRRFHRYFDVSVRRDPDSPHRWVANSLSDLTKRENRFAHLSEFPHAMNVSRIRHTDPRVVDRSARPTSLEMHRTPLVPWGTVMDFDADERPNPDEAIPERENRSGEDVVLRNVLAFDLRVFDPTAPIIGQADGSGSLAEGVPVMEPSDVGFRLLLSSSSPPPVVGRGAYVDLAYMGDPSMGTYEDLAAPQSPVSLFSRPPQIRAGYTGFPASILQNNPANPAFLIRSSYDTWSLHYEYDGLDQDGNGSFDQGTNGVDDDGINGVDDLGERETLPPYLTPLRGMEAKLRIYEPDSRIIREVSVKHAFPPQ